MARKAPSKFRVAIIVLSLLHVAIGFYAVAIALETKGTRDAVVVGLLWALSGAIAGFAPVRSR